LNTGTSAEHYIWVFQDLKVQGLGFYDHEVGTPPKARVHGRIQRGLLRSNSYFHFLVPFGETQPAGTAPIVAPPRLSSADTLRLLFLGLCLKLLNTLPDALKGTGEVFRLLFQEVDFLLWAYGGRGNWPGRWNSIRHAGPEYGLA